MTFHYLKPKSALLGFTLFIVALFGFTQNAFAQSITLDGDLQLQGFSGAPAGGIDLLIEAYDVSSDNAVTQSVSISQGGSQTSFSISVPQDTNAQWRISYSCITNCAKILGPGYYAGPSGPDSTQTTTDIAAAQPLPGNTGGSVFFTVLAQNIVSGQFRLPTGFTAPSEGLEIIIELVNTTSGEIFSDEIFISFFNDSEDFSLTYSWNTNTTWYLRYRCLSSCDGYLSPAYLGQVTTVADQTEASSYFGDVDLIGLNFYMFRLASISGQLVFPTAFSIPPSGAQLLVEGIEATTNEISSTLVDIPFQSTEVDYLFYFIPDFSIAPAEYQLRYTCVSNCENLYTPAYFSFEGTVIDAENADTLLIFSPDTFVDINILERTTLSGDVTLPEDVALGVRDVAPVGGIEFSIEVVNQTPLDPDAPEMYETVVTIPEGESFAGYSLSFAKDDFASWLLSYRCITNCEDILSPGFYRPDIDTAVDGLVPISLPPEFFSFEADLAILDANTMSGIVSLPFGDVAGTGGIDLTVEAYEPNYDMRVSVPVNIPEGASSATYSLEFAASYVNLNLGFFDFR